MEENNRISVSQSGSGCITEEGTERIQELEERGECCEATSSELNTFLLEEERCSWESGNKQAPPPSPGKMTLRRFTRPHLKTIEWGRTRVEKRAVGAGLGSKSLCVFTQAGVSFLAMQLPLRVSCICMSVHLYVCTSVHLYVSSYLWSCSLSELTG